MLFEALEPRVVMSADFTDGLLTVQGGEEANTVVIEQTAEHITDSTGGAKTSDVTD